jgi:hypothetical protein
VKSEFTRYLRPSKKPIVYNVLRTASGWQVQAFLPKRVSPDDRVLILDWFHSYRSQVQLQHPQWLTTFRFTEQSYFLDIISAENQKEMIVKAAETIQGWQQLDLEYV